jgi:hypothetical protein
MQSKSQERFLPAQTELPQERKEEKASARFARNDGWTSDRCLPDRHIAGHERRSKMPAAPMPPPMHMVTMP